MNYIQLQQPVIVQYLHKHAHAHTHQTYTQTRRQLDLSGDSGVKLLGLSPAGSDPISEQKDRQADSETDSRHHLPRNK